MEPPVWKIIWGRTKLRLRRLARRAHGRGMRRFMGVVMIVRAFNPLIFLLTLALLFYVLVIQPVRVIQANVRVVQTELGKAETALSDELDKVKDTLGVVKSILDPLKVVTQALVDAYNAVCGNDACKIDFPDLQIGVDLGPFNRAVGSVRAAIQNIQHQITGMFSFTLISPTQRAAVTGILVLVAGWILLSTFASVYTRVIQGVDLYRSAQRPAPAEGDGRATGLGRPVFETPPILVMEHALINISQVSTTPPAAGGRRGQQIQRRGRVLLSAQAVWPTRHQDLFHYELAEAADVETWSRFFENLILRGLDAERVQLVISPDTRALSPVASHFLPNAKVQSAVETTIVSG
jgi:hypothetical protein